MHRPLSKATSGTNDKLKLPLRKGMQHGKVAVVLGGYNQDHHVRLGTKITSRDHICASMLHVSPEQPIESETLSNAKSHGSGQMRDSPYSNYRIDPPRLRNFKQLLNLGA